MLFETFWEHTVRLVVNCWSYGNRLARCIFSFPRMDTPFDFDRKLFYLQKQTFRYQVPLDNPSISSHILSVHSYSEILKGNSSYCSLFWEPTRGFLSCRPPQGIPGHKKAGCPPAAPALVHIQLFASTDGLWTSRVFSSITGGTGRFLQLASINNPHLKG